MIDTNHRIHRDISVPNVILVKIGNSGDEVRTGYLID